MTRTLKRFQTETTFTKIKKDFPSKFSMGNISYLFFSMIIDHLATFISCKFLLLVAVWLTFSFLVHIFFRYQFFCGFIKIILPVARELTSCACA